MKESTFLIVKVNTFNHNQQKILKFYKKKKQNNDMKVLPHVKEICSRVHQKEQHGRSLIRVKVKQTELL